MWSAGLRARASGNRRTRRLLQHTNNDGLLTRLREIEHRYRLTCSQCGHEFWVEPKLLKTSVFDGALKGFRCPKKGCDAIVAWEAKQ